MYVYMKSYSYSISIFVSSLQDSGIQQILEDFDWFIYQMVYQPSLVI